jgi:hypothetical protein
MWRNCCDGAAVTDNRQKGSGGFNVFNFATFGAPGSTLGSPSFGFICSTATAERQIQFGLRFVF